MDWHALLHNITVPIQAIISICGVLIILSGVVIAMYHYATYLCKGQLVSHHKKVNAVRLNLGRILILGLEFIVASDLISTTTTPDYYAVGIVAIIVLIRTVLSFSLSRELTTLNQENS
jgi:uncharacterized membrane protein